MARTKRVSKARKGRRVRSKRVSKKRTKRSSKSSSRSNKRMRRSFIKKSRGRSRRSLRRMRGGSGEADKAKAIVSEIESTIKKLSEISDDKVVEAIHNEIKKCNSGPARTLHGVPAAGAVSFPELYRTRLTILLAKKNGVDATSLKTKYETMKGNFIENYS